MKLKKLKENSTGLNIEFIDMDTNKRVLLDRAIKEIDKGNPEFKKYEKVKKSNGTVYIRSKPDRSKKNNIEND